MGGKSQKTTTETKPPAYIEAAYKGLLGRAGEVSQTPYDPATESQVAGFTAPQQQAFQNTQNIQGIQNPYLTQAQQYAQSGASTISGDNIAQYLNPYQSQVIDATMAQIGRNNAMQQSQLTGNAALRGALGGDRVGVAQAELARNQDMNTQNILAQMNQQNYNQALAAAQGDKSRAFQGSQLFSGLGNQAQQAGYQDIGALLGIGGQQQALGQQQFDTATANAQQAAQYPFATTEWLAGITQGLGGTAGGTSTQTTPGPSALSQIAGVGLTAASLFSDERVKEDVEPVGATFDGQPIYKFRYKGDPAMRMGLMAQDVEQRHPEAVGNVGGIKTVDYDQATKGFANGGWLGNVNNPMLMTGLGMLTSDETNPGAALVDAMQYADQNREKPKPLFPETGKAIGTTLSGMFGGRNLSGFADGGNVGGPPSHMDDVLSRVQHAAQGLSAARKANGGSVDVRKGIGRPIEMQETSPGQWAAPEGRANGGISKPYAAGDDLFNALLQQESGNRDIQGPLITAGANAGDRAFGPAQIMPKTAQSPGYGVSPFNPNAADPVEENRRFGRDYLNAMLNEFGGDEEAALIAYNAGPGNAQKWLASGRDYSVLPQRGQTEPYAGNIMAMAGREGGAGIGQPTAMSSSPPVYADQGGVGAPAAAESDDGGWNINMPLLAAGLSILGSDSPFPGVAIGQGGMQGVGVLMKQREAKAAAKKLADAAAAAQERLGIQRESLEERKRHNLASEAQGSRAALSKNVIWGADEEGNSVILQASPEGELIRSKLPEGVKPIRDTIRVDAGDRWVLLDPVTRTKVGEEMKNLREAASETAAGAIEGKTSAEASAKLPFVESATNRVLGILDSLDKSPMREAFTGYSGYLPNMSPEANDYQGMLDQVAGNVFLQAFNDLRGGGAITEAEGNRATASLTRLGQVAPSDAGYQKALDDTRAVMREILDNARKRAGLTDQTPEFQPPPDIDNLKQKYGLE